MILPLALAYLLAGRINADDAHCAGLRRVGHPGGNCGDLFAWRLDGLCAALLTLLGIFIGNRHHRLPALVLGVVLLAGGGIFFAKYLTHTGSYIQRVGRVLDNQSAAGDYLDMRRDLWVVAIQMWRDNFWWGAGPAHFNYRYPAYRPARIQMQPDRAHNDYLKPPGRLGHDRWYHHARRHRCLWWRFCGGPGTMSGVWKRNSRAATANRFAFFIGRCGGSARAGGSFRGGFQPAHSRQRDPRRHVACAVEQQPALCHGKPIGSNLRLPLKLVTTLAIIAGIYYLSVQEFHHGAKPSGSPVRDNCHFFHPNAPPPWKRPLPPIRKIFRPRMTSANVTARKVSTAGNTTSPSRRLQWDGFYVE